MAHLKDTHFYNEAFQKLSYPFGDFYLFENFIVSEIKSDIVFTWDDHAKKVVEDITHLYDHDGSNLVYISNRINDYSVSPSDWVKFFKYNYNLKGYAVVSKTNNSILEKIFMGRKMRTFNTLDTAIEWAKLKIAEATPKSA